MPLRNLTLFTHLLESSSQASKELVPSLDLPLPQTVEFCSQLPAINSTAEALLLASFQEMISKRRGLASFTWAVSNYLPSSVKLAYEELVKNYFPPSETIALIDQLIKNPPPLLIADMGPLGYGLFAKSKIRKGTPVCTYMGKLIPSDNTYVTKVDRVYTVGVRTSSTLTTVFPLNTDNGNADIEIAIDRSQLFPAFIDGSEYGNYGSFLQHLPSAKSIAGVKDKAKIATANLTTIGADYRYYPCYYFRASRDIEANELLGFDYGENYWKAMDAKPVFFDRYGNVLDLTP